eukprot:6173632-Pleurochrysis_carterae.AAC.1
MHAAPGSCSEYRMRCAFHACCMPAGTYGAYRTHLCLLCTPRVLRMLRRSFGVAIRSCGTGIRTSRLSRITCAATTYAQRMNDPTSGEAACIGSSAVSPTSAHSGTMSTDVAVHACSSSSGGTKSCSRLDCDIGRICASTKRIAMKAMPKPQKILRKSWKKSDMSTIMIWPS